jgi:hypothetical protein
MGKGRDGVVLTEIVVSALRQNGSYERPGMKFWEGGHPRNNIHEYHDE